MSNLAERSVAPLSPPLSKSLPNWVKGKDVLILGAASLFLVTFTATGHLPFGWWEVFGFVIGAINVWLFVRQSIWAWPTGIVMVGIFAYLFYDAKLYADMALQFGFMVMSVYGWIYWLRGGAGRTEKPVTNVSLREGVAVVSFITAATYFMTGYLESIGGSAPFLDALTTSLSIGAQWLLSRRILQNWLIWIVADLIYIPLYIYKDLPLTGILYIAFLTMCMIGYRDWKKSLA